MRRIRGWAVHLGIKGFYAMDIFFMTAGCDCQVECDEYTITSGSTPDTELDRVGVREGSEAVLGWKPDVAHTIVTL